MDVDEPESLKPRNRKCVRPTPLSLLDLAGLATDSRTYARTPLEPLFKPRSSKRNRF